VQSQFSGDAVEPFETLAQVRERQPIALGRRWRPEPRTGVVYAQHHVVRVEVRADGDAPAVRTARNAVHEGVLHQWLQRKRGHKQIITLG
jgi:hypothetical protein